MLSISSRSNFGLNFFCFIIPLTLLLNIHHTIGALHTQGYGKPLLPSSDPFYVPPAGFENEKPGTILRSRDLGNNSLAAFRSYPQNIESVHQYLYRTTDGLGNPVATVTTLAIPFNADFSKLVSHQIAEDGASIDCAPSYAFQYNTKVRDYLVQVEMLFIDTFLTRGWPVCFSDYEGPDAMFTVGRMAGHGVLDGIRAVMAGTRIKSDAQIQLWGYSGGALATGWASQLHSTYAPELNIIGAAFGGTPVNLLYSVAAIKGQSFSSFGTMSILGMMNQYKSLTHYVETNVYPEKRKELYWLKNECITSVLTNHGEKGLDYFLNADNIIDVPVVKQILLENTLGGAPPKFPLFMYHSMKDHVLPFEPAKKLYTDWCNQGARIEFVVDRYQTHARLEYLGAPNAFVFMEQRFKGIRPSDKCSETITISSAFNLKAIRVFGEAIWDAMNAIFGYPLGPIKPSS